MHSEEQTNEELVKRYQMRGSPEALEEICKKNSGLVWSTVRDFRTVYQKDGGRGVIEPEDIAQDGYIGLINAVRSYDPARGASFATTARYYIRGAIYRSLYDQGRVIRLPENVITTLHRIRRFRSVFLSEHGRQPTQNEISSFLNVSLVKVNELQKLEIQASVTSLDQPMNEDGEGVLSDFIPDNRNEVEAVEDSMINEKVWEMVDFLQTDERNVIRSYYKNGKTLKEIAESTGSQPHEIKRIKETALKNLRTGKQKKELRQLAREYEIAETKAMKGGIALFTRLRMSATERAAFIRLEATEQAAHKILKRGKFDAAGLSRREIDRYFDMLQEKREAEEQRRLQELKEG